MSSRRKNAVSLDPARVPAPLHPWIDIVERHGPHDFEGEESHQLFLKFRGNRKLLKEVESRLSSWGPNQVDAYHQWCNESPQTKEYIRFQQFLLLFDAFDIHPPEPKKNPIRQAMEDLQEATRNPQQASNLRRIAASSLRHYGNFAHTALGLLRAALSDNDLVTCAVIHSAIAEISQEFGPSIEALNGILATMDADDPALSARDSVFLKANRAVVEAELTWLNSDQSIRDADSLRIAASSGHIERLKELLTKVPVDAVSRDGQTALVAAVGAAQVEAVRILLKHGADPKIARGGPKLIHMAVRQRRQAGLVQLLVEHGVDVAVRDEDGKTPSEIALELGNDDYVPLLLKRESPC